MSPAENVCKWAKSLHQVSSYRMVPVSERLRQIACCEALVGWNDPAIAEAVEGAAALWVGTETLFFLESGKPDLTALQEAEATAMICAKARVIHEAVYSVWSLEGAGVLTGHFHSETPELAFLHIWKRMCPAAEGWNDDRLRKALLEILKLHESQ